jgi:hypothetical protein
MLYLEWVQFIESANILKIAAEYFVYSVYVQHSCVLNYTNVLNRSRNDT